MGPHNRGARWWRGGLSVVLLCVALCFSESKALSAGDSFSAPARSLSNSPGFVETHSQITANAQAQTTTQAQTQDGKFIKKIGGFVAGVAKKFLGGGAAGAVQKATNAASKIAKKVKKGVGRLMMPPQPRPYGIGSPQINGAASRISRHDSKCVICQYVVQRVRAEMLLNGLGESVPYRSQLPGPSSNDAFSQLASSWQSAQSSAGVPMLSTAPGSADSAGSASGSSGDGSFLEMGMDMDSEDDDETEHENQQYQLPELPEDRIAPVSHHLHGHQLGNTRAVAPAALAEVDANAHSTHGFAHPGTEYADRLRFAQQGQQGFFDAIKKGASKAFGMVKGLLGGGSKAAEAKKGIAKVKGKIKEKKFPAPPYVPPFPPHKLPKPDTRSRHIWKTSREREEDMYAFRPVQSRYAGLYNLPQQVQQRAMERFENQQMMEVVFKTVQGICSHNMPRDFYQYCFKLMSKYQFVTRSLMWRDRPDSICMHMDMCNKKSYVQANPHSRLS